MARGGAHGLGLGAEAGDGVVAEQREAFRRS